MELVQAGEPGADDDDVVGSPARGGGRWGPGCGWDIAVPGMARLPFIDSTSPGRPVLAQGRVAFPLPRAAKGVNSGCTLAYRSKAG